MSQFFFSPLKTVPFYRYKSWKETQMNTEESKTELKAAVLEGGVRNIVIPPFAIQTDSSDVKQLRLQSD